MIFGVLNPEKTWHQQLVHFPPHLQPLFLGKSKKSFFNSIIPTYFRLFLNAKLFRLTEGNVAFHHALLKSSPCCNKTLLQLVRIVDWYTRYKRCCSIQTQLYKPYIHWVWSNTGSITETCCWCRSCYQQSAALLETCLSSSKTMRQHIVLVTQLSFCTEGQFISLTCGQRTVLTSTRVITAYGTWCKCTEYQSAIRTSQGSVLIVAT